MHPKNVPNEVLKTIEDLVRFYLRRRRSTVIELIIHYRPNLVKAFDLITVLGVTDIEKQYQYFLEHYKGDDKHFSGVWNEEWKYHLHGIGCEIVHILTGEYFDWDIGHPDVFSSTEVYKYLKWFMSYYPDDIRSKLLANWSTNWSLELLENTLTELTSQNILIFNNGTWMLI